MSDELLAAESWELFAKRDRSVLVDNLYGQFKSTLECQKCGKVSLWFVGAVCLLVGVACSSVVPLMMIGHTP